MTKRAPTPKRTASSSWFGLSDLVDRRNFLIVIAIALLARIIYIAQLKGSYFYGLHILDSAAINQWAQQIANGVFSDGRPLFRAPLYGFLIGFVYAVFGTGPMGPIVSQTALGLGIVYLTFVYARHLFGSKVALVSAAIVALYPTLIFYESELMITTVEVFLGLLALIFAHRAFELRSRGSLLIAGLVLGLAAITRPTFLMLAPLLPALLLIEKGVNKKSALTAAAIYIGAMVLPILPVTIHNVVEGNEFVLISSQGGSNFYLGNSKDADGLTARQFAPSRGDNYYQDNIMSIETAQREAGRRLTDAQASSYWMSRAWSDIGDSPARALGLMLKKFYLFWHGQEIFNIKSLYYAGEYSWLMKILIWRNGLNFPSGLLFPLMFAGIYLAVREKRNVTLPVGYLLLYAIAIALFFVTARFRQPVIPVAAMFAGFAIIAIVDLLRSKGAKSATTPLVIFVIAAVLLNLGGDVDSKANQSQHNTLIGNMYFSQRNYGKAIEYFEQALQAEPDNTRAISQLGVAYAESSQPDKAVAILQQGIARSPDYAGYHNNLGNVYARSGKFAEAAQSFKQAIKLAPNSVDAYLGLAQVFELVNLPDSARINYEAVLQLAPNHPIASQRLSKLPRN